MDAMEDFAIAMVSVNRVTYNSAPDTDWSKAQKLGKFSNLPESLQVGSTDFAKEWEAIVSQILRCSPNIWQTSAPKDLCSHDLV